MYCWGVYLPGGRTCPGGVLARGVYLPGGVPARGCACPGVPALGEYMPGVYLPGGVPARGVYLPRGLYLPGGVPARRGGTCPGTPPPPVNRMTDRCKNITLPQTSFADGNKCHYHTPL